MRRHQIIARILLLYAINFTLAVPVSVRTIREALVDVLDVADSEDVSIAADRTNTALTPSWSPGSSDLDDWSEELGPHKPRSPSDLNPTSQSSLESTGYSHPGPSSANGNLHNTSPQPDLPVGSTDPAHGDLNIDPNAAPRISPGQLQDSHSTGSGGSHYLTGSETSSLQHSWDGMSVFEFPWSDGWSSSHDSPTHLSSSESMDHSHPSNPPSAHGNMDLNLNVPPPSNPEPTNDLPPPAPPSDPGPSKGPHTLSSLELTQHGSKFFFNTLFKGGKSKRRISGSRSGSLNAAQRGVTGYP